MKIYRSRTHRIIANTFAAVCSVALVGCSQSARAADSAPTKSATPTVAFRPAINGMVDVLTPQGMPREYTTAAGTTLWSQDQSLFIYKGDKVKLSVFVSTGAFELKHVKVRLDNVPLASIDRQPWDVVVDTTTLDAGYHMFQLWAQSDSPAPYSSSEQNITFYLTAGPPPVSGTPAAAPVANSLPPVPAPSGAPVASLTAGSQPAATGSAPQTQPASFGPALNALPKLIEARELVPDATVQLKVGTDRVVIGEDSKPLELSGPLDVVVSRPVGSTSQRFVYALYREGAIVYQTDQFLPVNGTRVRLQARTSSAPGLLPGVVTLKAWGVDQNGKFGPVSSVPINIPVSTAEETVK